MKICAYVQEAYAKSCYKNECLDTRQFVGLRIIIDCLERSGYEVEFAGIATVHTYDIALVSITSDCDWWSFIGERIRWKKSDTKVLVGGAGVLHVSPFIRWVYAVMFGRGENLIVPLIDGIRSGNRYEHDSIAYSDSFSPDNIYHIAQVEQPYRYEISLTSDKKFIESTIGCNYRCLFCGYTWQRKFIWGLIGAYTEGLPSVMLSALAHRGGMQDSENIARLCATKKFWSASSSVKEKTLSKYFDMDYLFGPFTNETLPSRYLRTYAQVEKMWGNTPLERETNAKSETL